MTNLCVMSAGCAFFSGKTDPAATRSARLNRRIDLPSMNQLRQRDAAARLNVSLKRASADRVTARYIRILYCTFHDGTLATSIVSRITTRGSATRHPSLQSRFSSQFLSQHSCDIETRPSFCLSLSLCGSRRYLNNIDIFLMIL